MKLSLIVAMSENRVIGQCGELPWRLSSDLRRFKRLTMGHHILMGRKTFDSIGMLLPGRSTIVMTRQTDYEVPGGSVAHDLQEALRLAGQDTEAFVIGGGEVFRQTLPVVDKLYITQVHADVEGNTLFPELQWNEWNLVQQEHVKADSRNEFSSSFRVYLRREPRQRAAYSGPVDWKG